MSKWWDTATEQARLAQLDGAIECGMTARQFLASIGEGDPEKLRVNAVLYFATSRGRRFNGSSVSATRAMSIGARRRIGGRETDISGAFCIFDNEPFRNGNLFNAHPND